MRSSVSPLLAFAQPAHPLQIFRRIHRDGTVVADPDLDGDPVPNRAQLLEAFGTLQRRLWQPGKALQGIGGEAVDADVRERRHLTGSARIRDQRTREVESPAARVEDDLYDLRTLPLPGL